MRKRRRKNPDGTSSGSGSSSWGYLIGGAAALTLGYGAYRLLKNPAPTPMEQAAAQAAAQQQAQAQQAASAGFAQRMQQLQAGGAPAGALHGGVAAVDHHGIPTINLPAESAARTQQARLFAPGQQGGHQLPAPQGSGMALNLGGNSNNGNESFGGEEGSLGGERF